MKRIFAFLLALACLTGSACAAGLPRFERLEDATDYLRESAEACEVNIEFYLAELDELADLDTFPQRLRVLTGQHTVNVAWDRSTDWVSVNVHYYPGTRMARAAETGDRSGLTAEENAALEIACLAVEDLKRGSEYETELAIHNWLCENVEYENAPEYISGEIPRMCTALGALLDGKANCQGYSDAFWMLCRMAGLNVRRQDGWCDGFAHQWNLIALDDEWYIVDVTHNDMDDPGAWQYMWMNVGLDMAEGYEWNADEAVAPVAENTDPDAFYYTLNGLLFESTEHLAEYAADLWKENPDALAEGMIVDVLCTTDMLHGALGDALREEELSGTWTLWRVAGDRHTYCRIEFCEGE